MANYFEISKAIHDIKEHLDTVDKFMKAVNRAVAGKNPFPVPNKIMAALKSYDAVSQLLENLAQSGLQRPEEELVGVGEFADPKKRPAAMIKMFNNMVTLGTAVEEGKQLSKRLDNLRTQAEAMVAAYETAIQFFEKLIEYPVGSLGTVMQAQAFEYVQLFEKAQGRLSSFATMAKNAQDRIQPEVANLGENLENLRTTVRTFTSSDKTTDSADNGPLTSKSEESSITPIDAGTFSPTDAGIPSGGVSHKFKGNDSYAEVDTDNSPLAVLGQWPGGRKSPSDDLKSAEGGYIQVDTDNDGMADQTQPDIFKPSGLDVCKSPQIGTAAAPLSNEEVDPLSVLGVWDGVQSMCDSGGLSTQENDLLSILDNRLRIEDEKHQEWNEQITQCKQKWLKEEEYQYDEWKDNLVQQERDLIVEDRDSWGDIRQAEYDGLLSDWDKYIDHENKRQLSFVRQQQEEQFTWIKQHSEIQHDRLQHNWFKDWQQHWEQRKYELSKPQPTITELLSNLQEWLGQREEGLDRYRNQQFSWMEDLQGEQHEWLEQSRQQQNIWLDTCKKNQQDWSLRTIRAMQEGNMSHDQWNSDFSQHQQEYQQNFHEYQQECQQNWQQQQQQWQQNLQQRF